MTKRSILFSLLLLIFRHTSFCQLPVVKVDLNMSGRPESEVNEPGYTAWPIVNDENVSVNIRGINIKLLGSFNRNWYKAGIQSPNFARLVNDGIISDKYIEVQISGLPPGNHTLLTFHNFFSKPQTNTFSPIDIYLNGKLVHSKLTSSCRVLSNESAATAYVAFHASRGEIVSIRFVAGSNSSTNDIRTVLCGFELNTPNPKYQAKTPFPTDGNEHVETTGGKLMLHWKPAKDATSNDIYVGDNYQDIVSANNSSPVFQGNFTDTTFELKGLYNLDKYYWRIDEHDSSGKITRGDIWYFRPAHLAFPGAEGYGRYAIGGRGGKVVEVSNLNDRGPGSLREAITNDIGPRTIVFAVSGIITLQSRLTISSNYITIAGQTAPGKGICIRHAPLGMSGVNDVIMRHMRVRIGSGTTYDGMGMNGSNFSIIDHCSISWTIDEAFSSRSAKNITLQHTLISEALNVAGHQNYEKGKAHGYAASIGGDIGSFHHNLLAHCSGRNWSLAGGLDGNGLFAGRMDIFNNVIYNWNTRVTDGGAHEVNFVNNYYKPGPAWKKSINYALKAQYDNFPGTQKYYFSGNIMTGVFNESNQDDGRIYTGTPQGYSPWADSAFFPSYATIDKAKDGYKKVLSDVGATQPVFDNHDKRIVRETLDSSFTYRGSYTNLAGIPDADKDVGGWENYPSKKRAEKWDSDHDGLPDWWENTLGLDPGSPVGDFSEANADPDRDGFTQLEDYLNWMATPHFFIAEDSTLALNLRDYSRGFTNTPLYRITSVVNGSVDLRNDHSLVQFHPDKKGFSSFSFLVTDNTGAKMDRKICIYVGDIPGDTLFQPKE
jgi:hypothetical protein